MPDRTTPFKIGRRALLGSVGAIGAIAAARSPFDNLIGRAYAQTPATSGVAPLPMRQDFVVRGAYVMSVDPGIGDLPTGDVLVRNGTIAAIGTDLAAPGVEVIDGRNMLAMPGLIETHFHIWTSFLRGLIGDGEMDYFPVVTRVGPHITPDVAYHSVKLGIAEALYSGLTTIHDWSHNLTTGAHADADIRALRELGIRSRFTYGYSRVLQRQPKVPADFDDIRRVQQVLQGDELLTMGFAPRGPGDTQIDVYGYEIETARKLGLPITFHANRSLREVKRFRRIEMLYKDGLLGPDMLLVHTYNASEEERGMMGEKKVSVSTSPYTASRLASGLPWLGDLIKRGVQCSLSVDTTTVGGSVDMFGVMRLALQLNHLRSMDVMEVQPRKIVELATIDGARSLGIADRTGSLTPGKRADMILIRTDDINVSPFHDPALMVVQSAQPHNVDTVVVDGRILKRNREMTAIDLRQIAANAKDVQTRLWEMTKP